MHSSRANSKLHGYTVWTPGLGASIARLLLTATPPVSLVTVSRSPAPSGTVGLPDGSLHKHTHVQVDLTTPSGPDEAIKVAISTYGRLDGLVLNHAVLDPVERIAGGSGNITESAVGIEEWKKTFDVNFFSVVGLVSQISSILRNRIL